MSALHIPGLALTALVLLTHPSPGSGSANWGDVSRADPRVSLAFVDSDIRDALRLVAKQCGVNLVVSNEVQGTITLELEQATLTETLDAIAAVGGVRYSTEGTIVTVQTLDEILKQRKQQDELAEPAPEPLPAESHTLVLNLRYVDAERVEPVVKNLLSEDGIVSVLKTSDHLAQERGAVTEAPSTGTALQIGTQLTTSSVGEPAKSHTLVVLDTPERLTRIESVVASIDQKPPQVVIEARFVEIALDDEQRLGIDWNVLARMNGGAVPHTGPFGSSSLGWIDPKVEGDTTDGVYPGAPNLVTTPTEPGLFTFGTLDFTAFTAILEMIQRDTDVQMVSNPRIVVRDRHTATILVGERYPILSANISEFGTVTEQLDHYEPIGVQLAVTPSVLGEEVELLVRPSTSSLGSDVLGSTGLGIARINSRQIDTLVTVRDGQTVVVGGLITSREVDTHSRVPFLGSIPFLGRLFRHDGTRTERVDLVVFLTVSIEQENSLTPDQRRLFEDTTLGEVPGQETAPSQAAELEMLPSPPAY